MPFDMFRLFRNRRDRGDVAAFEDDHGQRGRRYLLRRPSKIFTPLPSRAPTDPEEEYRDEYMRVHSPSTLMGGTLNARPTTLEDPVSPSSLRGYSNRSEYPRLPHDDIPYADAYHESMAGRGNPEDPIVINHSSRSMSQTPSDRTFENHRPAAFEYPGTRIYHNRFLPLPHHRQRDYVAAGAPTNIYGSHHHDAYPEARGIRRAESYRREPIRNHSKRGRPAYYIVPHGMDVVFQDGTGREIHRAGNFSGRRRPVPPAPFVVQDSGGREVYRYDGSDGSRREPQILQVYMSRPRGSHGRSHSSPIYHVEPLHDDPRYDHRYNVDRRGYGRYGNYENHRNHSGRGAHRDPREYDDYRGRGPSAKRPRHLGEHEDHRDYEVYTAHGQPERHSPFYWRPPVDDRRSGMSGVYEGSIHGGMPPEPFDEEITDRLDSFHMT
ncbi:hypothetical protein BKA83DRAFT_4186651 [Pisolithus microcarpus]|nr:hypothetical protein BKA83DRAFT_4186651 [Pisolithus microcarpus]